MANSELEIIRGLKSIDKNLDRIADALEYMVRADKAMRREYAEMRKNDSTKINYSGFNYNNAQKEDTQNEG